MAHGDYYNPANKSVTDGTVVYADDINKINTAVDSALEQVAYDLDVLESDLEAGGLSAKNWATEDQGTRPDPILDLYSAKAYALEAKDWASASGTITEASTGAALAGSASAKTKAAEAANSALAASGSASSAAGSAITATNKAGEALSSANAAALSETNAGNSAISAAASAANLPNATTAGANKLLTTNSSGNGWEYPSITTAGKAILDDASAAAQRTTLGLGNVANVDTTNANNIISGTLAEGRIPSTIARDSEVAALFSSRSRKNLLINGDFGVAQRGISFESTGYIMDRWRCISKTGAGTGVITKKNSLTIYDWQQVADSYLEAQLTGEVEVVFGQNLDSLQKFSGKTVTVSFDAKCLSVGSTVDVSVVCHYGSVGGSTDDTFTDTISISTDVTRKSYTVTLPDFRYKSFGTDPYLDLQFTMSNSSGSLVFMISNVQLEFGYTATDFEYRHPAEELALCQRYYERGVSSIPKIFNQLTSTSARSQAIPYKVTKRVTPTCVVGSFSPSGHDGTPGTLTVATTTDELIAIAAWAGGTPGRAFSGLFTWTADAEL